MLESELQEWSNKNLQLNVELNQKNELIIKYKN